MACFAAALCCGFLSYVFSVKFAVQTPAYRLYIQKLQAQSTTQPGGAMISHAPFVGQAYINRSVLTFPTTYFAVAFVGVGVAILVLKRIAQAHEPEA